MDSLKGSLRDSLMGLLMVLHLVQLRGVKMAGETRRRREGGRKKGSKAKRELEKMNMGEREDEFGRGEEWHT
jgi:hypothetical protein